MTRPLRTSDLLRLGVVGLRTRPLRVVLSALGIAIGIGAMVAVVGISSSSQARSQTLLDGIGTNVVAIEGVAPGGEAAAPLPDTTIGSLTRRDDVESAAAVSRIVDIGVYRSDLVEPNATGGIVATSVQGNLLRTLRGEVAGGRWLLEGGGASPAEVVLGASAAATLGIDEVGPETVVWMDGRRIAVVGILEPLPLAPELDLSAFVSDALADDLAVDLPADRAWARVDPESVETTSTFLAGTIAPLEPGTVATGQPSDALVAQEASEASFTGLLVGIGGVALLVGGIGVANTMVISVLERRHEIGMRRAIGARRRDIRRQFLIESLLLSLLGGTAGVLVGGAITTGYAVLKGWPVAIPIWAVVGAIASTLVIGGLSGIWPATRAARTSPTVALSTA
ncbi:ABC transporter permease [Isoptericola halotolerans]|uniref:ABC transporter permease n=1 Tax=Isoptericola halotolerans TaxID=300560 RepID=UPI003890844B